MKVIQSTLTKNRCYKAGKTITPKGIMLHSVGVGQPSAKVFVRNFNNETISACPHAFIDASTGYVYQTLSWKHRGWHAGGSANDTHIGIEMCEPSYVKYTSGAKFTCTEKTKAKANVEKTYKTAVTLCAHLCEVYNLDPLKDGVIISHSEGYKRGIASNHADVEHLWKGLGTGYTMDGFRKDVKAAINGEFDKKPMYFVKVTADELNVRNGAGTNYKINDVIKDKGVYTIVDEKKGKGATLWGKLKSGAGWISLDFTKRL